MCPEHDRLSNLKGLEIGIFFFLPERDWSQEFCHGNSIVVCHPVSFWMHIAGAKFEDCCPNISGEILDLSFYRLFMMSSLSSFA